MTGRSFADANLHIRRKRTTDAIPVRVKQFGL